MARWMNYCSLEPLPPFFPTDSSVCHWVFGRAARIMPAMRYWSPPKSWIPVGEACRWCSHLTCTCFGLVKHGILWTSISKLHCLIFFSLKALFFFCFRGKIRRLHYHRSLVGKSSKRGKRSFNLLKVSQKSMSIGIMLFNIEIELIFNNWKSKIFCGTGSLFDHCF